MTSCIPGTSTSVFDSSDGKYVLCVAVFTISPHFGCCPIYGSQSPWYILKPQIAKGRRALWFHCQLASIYRSVSCCSLLSPHQWLSTPYNKHLQSTLHNFIIPDMHLLIILLYFATHLSTKSCGWERGNPTQSHRQALPKGELCAFTASHALIF